jgi:hypothetical protein
MARRKLPHGKTSNPGTQINSISFNC